MIWILLEWVMLGLNIYCWNFSNNKEKIEVNYSMINFEYCEGMLFWLIYVICVGIE